MSVIARYPAAAKLLRRHGGLARRKWLLATGMLESQLKRLVHTGELVRATYGWYAIPSLDTSLRDARLAGGALTGPSALAPRGVWRAHDKLLHVRVDRRHRARRLKGVCIHREPRITNATQRTFDHVAAAFLACFECQPLDELVAIGDHLVRENLLDYETFVDICQMKGRKGAKVLKYSDVRAESGLESILRTRLLGMRIKLTSQWRVSGARRYDFKVGRSLLIETDGREHHFNSAAFHADRDADQIATALGYTPLRLTYRHVMYEWPETARRIRTLIQRRRHLRIPWDEH